MSGGGETAGDMCLRGRLELRGEAGAGPRLRGRQCSSDK